jgi:hypothetical protein
LRYCPTSSLYLRFNPVEVTAANAQVKAVRHSGSGGAGAVKEVRITSIALT